MADTFTCAHCGRTFPVTIPDAEARAEAVANFGEAVIATEPIAVVCDDCYEEFMAWWKQQETGGA